MPDTNPTQAASNPDLMRLETVALLCGQTPEMARAEHAYQERQHPGKFVIPQAWLRKSKEIQAKHGTNDLETLLATLRQEQEATS